MNTVRSLSLVCVFAAAAALVSCASSSGGGSEPLDGRSYKVTLVSPSGDKMADDLFFKGGKFESTVCTSAGFAVSPYHAQAVEGGESFTVECDSPSMGHNEWHGTAKGDQIEGTVVRTPKGGAPINSTFSGSLVK